MSHIFLCTMLHTKLVLPDILTAGHHLFCSLPATEEVPHYHQEKGRVLKEQQDLSLCLWAQAVRRGSVPYLQLRL